MSNMRIIGGRHRGRRLDDLPDTTIRATRAKVRESVFNILMHCRWGVEEVSPLHEATVLDACCGSGAFGLEALSRGATSCLLLDTSRTALDLAYRNAMRLNESTRVSFICADVTRPPSAPRPSTVTFLDPPYRQTATAHIVTKLDAAGWIAPEGLVVIETVANVTPQWTHPFRLLDWRRYRHTVIYFLRRTKEEQHPLL